MGRDGLTSKDRIFDAVFQSTLPVWGGTAARTRQHADHDISIHPPRVGRDFYASVLYDAGIGVFQSTLPVWGGTRVAGMRGEA